MTPSSRTPLSVLIPTLNEQRNLPDCLASVAWADEVVVFDSYSHDDTLTIAAEHGARVVQREFDDFSTHKNWALEHIDFKHDWVLILDADERVTAELGDEIRTLLAGQPAHDAYHLARQIVWRGRWLKHGGRYPDWNLRLLRRNAGRYEPRLVHEHMVIAGRSGHLRHPLRHADDKGIERYIDRHNHYSTLEAVEILRAERGRNATAELTPGPRRRRALKTFAYRYLPFRPLWVFLYLYLVKAGFLDGRPGLDSALLRAVYEYQIDLKLTELRTPGSPLERRWRATIEESS